MLLCFKKKSDAEPAELTTEGTWVLLSAGLCAHGWMLCSSSWFYSAPGIPSAH